MIAKEAIKERFKELQDYICDHLEKVDGSGLFKEDNWIREAGGGGKTRTISKGSVIEKGGVAFSEVYGEVTPMMKKQLGLDGESFFATGVSIVLHPLNPHVPIIHMNVRYFELNTGVYWFGGGIDLTPHYIVPSLAKDFHTSLKILCDHYSNDFYSKFKVWADEYFYNTHREETRGIGGVFFDHLDENCGISKDAIFNFCIDLGELFPKVYSTQVAAGKNLDYSESEIKWRNIRRGRYAEFNLVHDRGTKFGLFSGGRTESILMSLPPMAEWEYCFTPEDGSSEYLTQKLLSKNLDWLTLNI